MTAYILAIAIQIGILMILTLALGIQFGMTGLINFGLVGFYAIGAYTSGLLTIAGVPIPVAIAVSAAMGGLAALPLGAVAIRLRAEYLAIVTLGFAEIIRLVALNERWLTQGTNGLGGVPRLFRNEPLLVQAGSFLLVIMGCILLIATFMHRLTASPYGRILAAIRDNEAAVAAVGKNANRFKSQVLAIGGAAAATAGALQAHYIGYVSPDQFTAQVTFTAWMAMILGGAGHVSGALVGAGAIMVFFEGSRFLRDAVPWVSEVQIANGRLMLVGLLLVLCTLYRPEGMMGGRHKR